MAQGVKIFFDGGCRPAPRGMETAVVIRGECHFARGLGTGTSMDAEWLALIHAMRLAIELGLDAPILVGDALAVIRQAKRTQRCPPQYRRHLATFDSLARDLGPCRIRYLKRTQNLAGIALESERV